MKKRLNNNYNFEETWRNALSGKEKIPDDRLWANIEQALPQPKAFWKRPIFWLISGTLLLGSLGLGYWTLGTPEQKVVNQSLGESNTPNKGKQIYLSEKAQVASIKSSQQENKIPADKQELDNLPNPEEANVQDYGDIIITPPQVGSNYIMSSDQSSRHPSITLLNPNQSKGLAANITKEKEDDNIHLIDLEHLKSLSLASSLLLHQSSEPQNIEQKQEKDLASIPNKRKWLSLNIATSQVTSNLQNQYQQYLTEYMQAHQHDMFDTRGFFTQSQEQLQNNRSYQINAEMGLQLSSKFYIQGGISYHFWQYQRQSNSLYQNLSDGSQHDFMAEMLKNEITNPSFIKALQAHDVYARYLQGEAPSDLYLEHFNAENTQAEIESRYHFINIPIRLGYQQQLNQKLKVNLELGLGFNYFLRNSNQSDILQNLENFNAKNNGAIINTHFNWSTGILAEYQLNPRLSTTLGLEYQQALSRITETQAYTTLQPEFLGLRFGVRYYWR